MSLRDRPPYHPHAWCWRVLQLQHRFLGRLKCPRRRNVSGWCWHRWHPAKIFLRQCSNLIGFDVPDYHQRCVVRRVPTLPPVMHIARCCLAQISDRPDWRMPIRMLAKDDRQPSLRQIAVGLVEIHPTLLLDHLAFSCKPRAIHCQESHPLRFQPEGQLQLLSGQSFVIAGLIERRVSIAVPAHAFDQVHVIRRP